MSIGGDNNRVAGRDYYEYSGNVELTLEQLRMLAVEPCPRCEERVIQFGKRLCNHCRCEIHAEAAQARRVRFALAILFLWGALMVLFEKHLGPVPSNTFIVLGGVSAVLVIVLSQLWAICRDVWQMNGGDIKRASGKAIARLIKGQ